MFKYISFVIILLAFNVKAQTNMNLLGQVDYQSLHNVELNDIWGYVDESGNEYALVGTTGGTSVVDVTIPSSPNEVFWSPGDNSIWRDLKTYGDYAYITTEALSGLTIIDLSPLPLSTALNVTTYNGELGSEWYSAHNLYIDENGFAYIFGANRGNGGVIILDIATDPMNPIEVGSFDISYVHDGYVRNDTMYLAHITSGYFSIVDISDKANPVLLGTQTTPDDFAHNIWLSDDAKYVFTTDEVSGGYVAAYDITDPSQIVELDRVQSSPGFGVIPHNTHVYGDFLVTSYYSDGVKIHDATYPYNLIEVGGYDTYPGQTQSYDGCWGAYPFLPSGNVLATDQQYGLFILGTTYMQAAYLEGNVTDADNLLPIENVLVEIGGAVDDELTNQIGFYAGGITIGGSVNVTYSKVGYYPQTLNVTLTNGVITTQDVQLVPIPPYTIDVLVLEEGTLNPISNANIRFETDDITHDGVSNGLGEENMTLYYQTEYTISAGKWGYITDCFTNIIDNTTGQITIYLSKGIYDDFSFDFGWNVSSSASTGKWERGIPFGTLEVANPDRDSPDDCGKHAFVTGNFPDIEFNLDDIDGGLTLLYSPSMDLSGFSDPYIQYYRWFYSNWGPNPSDDTLRILVNNGSQAVVLDKQGRDPALFNTWVRKVIRLSDYIPITSTMQIVVRASDFEPNWNVTEAGFDNFKITEGLPDSGLKDEIKLPIHVYPNPFKSSIHLEHLVDHTIIEVYDLTGKLIHSEKANNSSIEVNTVKWRSGLYFVHVNAKVFKLVKE